MSNSFVALSSRLALILLLLALSGGMLQAQLCQGSLGDPIINKTFGAGANPGAPLSAAATTYRYFAFDCPNDGSYTVVSNTNGCFGGTWHSVSSDHTGDPGGYFMLVNASIEPSAFYLDTVKGLCGGTTFEFAAWVMNVLRSGSCGSTAVQPNLTFTIEKTDGTVLQTYNTNTIQPTDSPIWKQFGFFFTTPTSVSDIVLRIYNNAPGGCGNDLALDDITFRPCGPQLIPSLNGSTVTKSVDYCEGVATNPVFSCAISAGFNSPSYQWQRSLNGGTWTDIPGANTTTYSPTLPANTAPGHYEFRLAAAEAGNLSSIQCRVVSQTLSIQINPNPVTTAVSNSPACENSTLVLTATGGAGYVWTGPNGFSANGNPQYLMNVQQNQSGKYYVLASSLAGCKHLDSTMVAVNPAPVAGTNVSSATICQGKDIQLVGTGGGTYAWTPASGLNLAGIANPVAMPADTIQYTLVVTNSFSCTDTVQSLINVIEKPRANAGMDKIIIKGTPVLLNASAVGQNLIYSWTPTVYMDNPSILQPTVTPPRDTTYVLKVVSADGCGEATDTVKILVFKDIYVPTAFSPNGNGKNDTWHIPALAAYSEYEITVFNRQGQVVWHLVNNNKPWDGKYKGKYLPIGVYVYMIEVRQTKQVLKGTLTILR